MAEGKPTDQKTIRGKRAQGNATKELLTLDGKVPPQAIDVEEAVLGALLLESSAVAEVVEILKPDSFYHPAHVCIFHAIQTLFQSSQIVDLITVTEYLRKNGELEIAGGPFYITKLTNRVASSSNVVSHARIVLEKAIMRDMISLSSEVLTKGFDETEDCFDLLDHAEAGLYNISQNNFRRGFESMTTLVQKAIKDIERASLHKDELSGVPSGFTELDRMTAGWQKSDLIIIAARPAMGKTAFVLSMARNMAVTFKKPTAVFSLEMSAVQLVTRLISSESRISSGQLRKGALTEQEWHQLNTNIRDLAEAPMFIDDTPSLSIFELRAKCRRLKQMHDIQCIIIDYLQLMTTGGEKSGNRVEEVGLISRSLKALAKELNVPVITLSQLSRSVETRGGDKRPMMSDLRESGSIEQDADMVLFIYRPEYYKIDSFPDGRSTQGFAEIIVEKHRNGATGNVVLRFRNEFARFEDPDTQDFDLAEEYTGDPNALANARPEVVFQSKMNSDFDGAGVPF